MRYTFILLIIILFSSCLRLDNNLYNLSEKITEYKRDKYTGEQDFILDNSYTIADSLIHEFTLSSQTADETSSTAIYATYIGNISKIATDTVIMYCHGNKWHMDFYWQRAKLLANTGSKNRYGVLMIDYRGYGLSKGEPSENGLYADVNAALAWLKSKGLNSQRLIMYGFSMGSAPAVKLTAQPSVLIPNKLILEAPFASAMVLVQDGGVLAMPSSFFTNLQINNAENIKQVNQPFLLFHGTNDLFLNIETNGKLVYKNYNGSFKKAIWVPGADHGEVPAKYGFQNYSTTLLDFIAK